MRMDDTELATLINDALINEADLAMRPKRRGCCRPWITRLPAASWGEPGEELGVKLPAFECCFSDDYGRQQNVCTR